MELTAAPVFAEQNCGMTSEISGRLGMTIHLGSFV
jgi:hypothetical protein